MSIEGVFFKVAGGAVATVVLAVGGMTYANHTTLQVQDARIERIERATEEMIRLTSELAVTNQNLAVLTVKLEVLQRDLQELKDGR